MRVCPGCRATYEGSAAFCAEDGLPLIDHSPTLAGLKPTETRTAAGDTRLQPGLVIGEYRVEGVIAEGGMGVVYAGIHPVIRKRVAIKVLSQRFAQDAKAVGRFVLEARAVNEIGHYGIVDIFSIGELDDRRNYLVMEYLDGLPLHQVLSRVGRLQPTDVLPIFEQLCDALRATHDKGFVHRDLKPQNVLVLRRPPYPSIKILDFGLAKLRGNVSGGETEVGMVLGTPEYMAPEQCRGGDISPRTDIYALGVMLYELLTGRRPFVAPSAIRVLMMQQREDPVPPSEHAPVSPALQGIILRAMEKDPDLRFQSVGELLGRLRRAVPERVPWAIDLGPLPQHPSGASAAPPVEALLPPPPQDVAVPEPVAISGEMSDEEMGSMVAETSGHGEASAHVLQVLRRKAQPSPAWPEWSGRPAEPAPRQGGPPLKDVPSPEPLFGVLSTRELERIRTAEVPDLPPSGPTDETVRTASPGLMRSLSATLPPLTPASLPAPPPADASASFEIGDTDGGRFTPEEPDDLALAERDPMDHATTLPMSRPKNLPPEPDETPRPPSVGGPVYISSVDPRFPRRHPARDESVTHSFGSIASEGFPVPGSSAPDARPVDPRVGDRALGDEPPPPTGTKRPKLSPEVMLTAQVRAPSVGRPPLGTSLVILIALGVALVVGGGVVLLVLFP